MFEALRASPVHYADMVDPGFRSFGVGAVPDEAGRECVTVTFMAGGSAPVMMKKVVRVCAGEPPRHDGASDGPDGARLAMG